MRLKHAMPYGKTDAGRERRRTRHNVRSAKRAFLNA
jgi:hypothetical protein